MTNLPDFKKSWKVLWFWSKLNLKLREVITNLYFESG